jgi:hypothetical protein
LEDAAPPYSFCLRVSAAQIFDESGRQGEIRQTLWDAGVIMLDGNGCEIHAHHGQPEGRAKVIMLDGNGCEIHAHHGQPEGRAKGGTPVFNVAMPLLKRAFPDHPPFRMLEVKVGPIG